MRWRWLAVLATVCIACGPTGHVQAWDAADAAEPDTADEHLADAGDVDDPADLDDAGVDADNDADADTDADDCDFPCDADDG